MKWTENIKNLSSNCPGAACPVVPGLCLWAAGGSVGGVPTNWVLFCMGNVPQDRVWLGDPHGKHLS